MWFVLAIGSVAVILTVAIFLSRVVKLYRTPAYVTVLALVAFFIPTFTVILLPIDLASGRADALGNAQYPDQPISYLSHRVLLKLWRASYWLSFSLTLTILPITQSFVESGYKEPMQRLLSSLRQNLRYQGIYVLTGLLGVVYIILNTKLRSFSDFKSLLIALANTWGLFLAINFLGHGLVNVPRRMWKSANYTEQKREIEIKATTVWEQLDEATTDELQLAIQVVEFEKSTADKEWLNEMASYIPAAVVKARSRLPRNNTRWFGSSSDRSPKDPTDLQLADLMQKIRNNKKERYQAEWNQLIVKYTFLVDCTSASSRHSLTHRTFRSRLSPRNCYWYYVHILPLARQTAAVLMGFVSLSILWGEILINKEDSSLRYVTRPITGWNIEVWSALLLAYMACCCYSTLLRLKIFDTYALLDRGHTSQSSLLFYASYCCRVTIPLSYNFVTLLPSAYRHYSTFSQFLASAIDLQPLGTAFNNWFPLYILIPVLLTASNSYDRLRRTFGFSSTWIDDDSADGINVQDGTAVEGRGHLRGEISQRYGELPSNAESQPRDGRTIPVGYDDDDNDDLHDRSPFLDSFNTEFDRAASSEQTHGSSRTRWSNIQHIVRDGLIKVQTRVFSSNLPYSNI